MSGAVKMINKIVRMPAAVEQTGLSRSTLYALMAKGEFVPKIQLSTRAIGFKSSDIDDWIERHAAKSIIGECS